MPANQWIYLSGLVAGFVGGWLTSVALLIGLGWPRRIPPTRGSGKAPPPEAPSSPSLSPKPERPSVRNSGPKWWDWS